MRGDGADAISLPSRQDRRGKKGVVLSLMALMLGVVVSGGERCSEYPGRSKYRLVRRWRVGGRLIKNPNRVGQSCGKDVQ